MSTKPFLSLDDQVALLESRGLIIRDREYAKHILASLNYYRFSAYSLTLRNHDVFNDGTTFEEICCLYNFDAALRSFVLKYTSSIETTLRAHMAYIHSKNYGALGYLDSVNFVDQWYHAHFLSRVQKLLDDSKEAFVVHHRNDLNGVYPFWVVVEVMTFDVASKCFQNMKSTDQAEISAYYGVHSRFAVNWMRCAVIARNIAAHCGRFYNRPIATKAIIPNSVKGRIDPSRIFSYLYGIYHLLNEEDEKRLFIYDFKTILLNYPSVERSGIGLPDEWESLLTAEI